MPTSPEQVDIEDDLYRRIVPDNVTNGELNAGAFSLRPGEDALSVDIARLTSVEECLARAGRPDVGLSVLSVGDVVALGLTVEHDPVVGDAASGIPANYAHARITGENSRAIRSKLAKAAVILVSPERRPS
ncbi:MAG TPA: hypothetical protein VFV93_06145 [Thermomicrobiales bacterium]|nr:hypothetical protein [Thermomicrobiales bacterium]